MQITFVKRIIAVVKTPFLKSDIRVIVSLRRLLMEHVPRVSFEMLIELRG